VITYFEFNEHHPQKVSHHSHSLIVLDEVQIFSTYLLTSVVELLNDARQCRMQDKTLDMHICRPTVWEKLQIS